MTVKQTIDKNGQRHVWYRNCHFSKTFPSGYWETYVKISYDEGRTLSADTLDGLKQFVTSTLAKHGLTKAKD